MIELDRFRIIEKIADGSMGQVFKAHQVSMDRTVAVKVLHPELARNESFKRRFIQETQAVGNLNHHNIVQGIDAGESNGHLYFAMEYVDGQSLYEILKQGPLEEDEVLEIGLQVAHALEHGHAQGIVHRDIKPGNIMIASDGTAKVTDYGLVRRADDGSRKTTHSGKAVGTPYYISPEQARGEEEIDIRSDIYSLGATLYHAATGQPPFPGRTAAGIMSMAVEEPFPDPRREEPELSAAFARLVLRLAEKDRNRRPANPSDLIREIERVMRASADERRMQTVGANLRRVLRRAATRGGAGKQLLSSRVKMAVVGIAAGAAVILLLSMLRPGVEEHETNVVSRQDRGAPIPRSSRKAPAPRDVDSHVEREFLKAQRELEEEARQAFLKAEKLARSTSDIEAAIVELSRVAAKHKGSYAEKAQQLAEEMQRKWDYEGMQVLEVCRKQVEEALAQEDYGTALEVYEDFPKHLLRSAAGPEVHRLKNELLKQVRAVFADILRRAELLAVRGDYDGAIKLYQKASAFGVPEISSQAKARIESFQEKRRVALARAERQKARRTKELYSRFYPGFTGYVEKGEFKKAIELCETLLADRSYEPVHDAVRRCGADVRMVVEVETAAREAAKGLQLQEYTFELEGGRIVKGLVKAVRGDTIDVELIGMKGAVMGVGISRLSGRTIAELAMKVLGNTPQSHLRCGVYFLLAKADWAEAGNHFELADAGGQDTSRYNDKLAELRKEHVEQEAVELYDKLQKLVKRKKWKQAAETAERLAARYEDTAVVKKFRAEIGRVHTDALMKLAAADQPDAKRPKLLPGLVGTYFGDRNFRKQRVQRIDSTIDFAWGDGSPHADVKNDNFSIRWEGFIAIPRSGRYTFIINSDDGVRMWLRGEQLMNDWVERGPTDSVKEVTLRKGYYPVKIEYYEQGGGACVKLMWSVDNRREVIPSKYLLHALKKGK